MFFQSFGAVSTIKVKSSWFHVRERGTFGAIFGTLISLGVYFAFDWGEAIANAVKLDQGDVPSQVHILLNYMFALDGRTVPALWLIFVIPAAFMGFWALIDVVVLRDTPDDAGFDDFETHDASHDDAPEKEYSYMELMRKIFSNKIIWTIGIIELTSGVLRNGILQWYKIFAKETGFGVDGIMHNWGFWGCVTGIAGGFLAGWMSDKLFHSRRSPSAGVMQILMFVCVLVMIIFLKSNPLLVGIAAVGIMMGVIGVHSIMSGTATADFGGRKASATATGVADAFAYAGSAIQSFALGKLTSQDWTYWPLFLLPFTVIGLYFAIKMWKEIPEATRRYLKDVEKKEFKR
jgi:OPA family glycerol-3-phosphate transporter-like MFS transporter